MAIIVTCPGCRKSFSVREEFAGRTGPCPKCKTKIKIPKASETVQVHGGEAFSSGGKTISGELVLKPLKRQEEARFQWPLVLEIAGGVLALMAVTWLLGGVLRSSFLVTSIGLILITPPLVYAPYFFLKDSEAIENLHGQELWRRTLYCSVAYVALWGGFAVVSHYGTAAMGGDLWVWLLLASPFAVVGAVLGSAFFNLETGDGAIHFAFYLIVTLLLRSIAGIPFVVGEYLSSTGGGNIPLDPRL
ncbi:MAG: hypothetical protein Q4D62_07215 [Planctomycetia bacterium]|nr:hypothetical protein [Planctomycetia bacterium]